MLSLRALGRRDAPNLVPLPAPEPAKFTGDKRSGRSPLPCPSPSHAPTAPLASRVTSPDAGLACSATRSGKPEIRATRISRADSGGRG